MFRHHPITILEARIEYLEDAISTIQTVLQQIIQKNIALEKADMTKQIKEKPSPQTPTCAKLHKPTESQLTYYLTTNKHPQKKILIQSQPNKEWTLENNMGTHSLTIYKTKLIRTN